MVEKPEKRLKCLLECKLFNRVLKICLLQIFQASLLESAPTAFIRVFETPFSERSNKYPAEGHFSVLNFPSPVAKLPVQQFTIVRSQYFIPNFNEQYMLNNRMQLEGNINAVRANEIGSSPLWPFSISIQAVDEIIKEYSKRQQYHQLHSEVFVPTRVGANNNNQLDNYLDNSSIIWPNNDHEIDDTSYNSILIVGRRRPCPIGERLTHSGTCRKTVIIRG